MNECRWMMVLWFDIYKNAEWLVNMGELSIDAWMHVWMHGCVDAWMCGCIDVWMHECVDAWMCGCMDAWMCGCMDAWMCGCMDVWMHGCVDAWMCGCMDVRMHVWMDTQPAGGNDSNLWALESMPVRKGGQRMGGKWCGWSPWLPCWG